MDLDELTVQYLDELRINNKMSGQVASENYHYSDQNNAESQTSLKEIKEECIQEGFVSDAMDDEAEEQDDEECSSMITEEEEEPQEFGDQLYLEQKFAENLLFSQSVGCSQEQIIPLSDQKKKKKRTSPSDQYKQQK